MWHSMQKFGLVGDGKKRTRWGQKKRQLDFKTDFFDVLALHMSFLFFFFKKKSWGINEKFTFALVEKQKPYLWPCKGNDAYLLLAHTLWHCWMYNEDKVDIWVVRNICHVSNDHASFDVISARSTCTRWKSSDSLVTLMRHPCSITGTSLCDWLPRSKSYHHNKHGCAVFLSCLWFCFAMPFGCLQNVHTLGLSITSLGLTVDGWFEVREYLLP